MAEGEQADINGDVLHPVQEEDHAQQKQDVVVSGDHVLGAEIDEGDQVDAADLLDVPLVTLRDSMGQGFVAQERQRQDGGEDQPAMRPAAPCVSVFPSGSSPFR